MAWPKLWTLGIHPGSRAEKDLWFSPKMIAWKRPSSQLDRGSQRAAGISGPDQPTPHFCGQHRILHHQQAPSCQLHFSLVTQVNDPSSRAWVLCSASCRLFRSLPSASLGLKGLQWSKSRPWVPIPNPTLVVIKASYLVFSELRFLLL